MRPRVTGCGDANGKDLHAARVPHPVGAQTLLNLNVTFRPGVLSKAL